MAERELVGCIHVHSTFSDGAVPAEDIVRIAVEAGLDFVAISDHRSDATREAGLTGWHGRLLCLSAPEIGGKHRPHFLALNPGCFEDLTGLDPERGLAEAERRGMMPFVAHVHPAELRLYAKAPVGWSDLEGVPLTGLEIWSYLHDVCHGAVPWRLHRLRRHHDKLVRGPRPETLALWDLLGRTRRVAGIGALDNHARRVPILGRLWPHEELFSLHRTHVLCDDLPEDGLEAERRLAEAMAGGRAFVAMDGWGDATGFRVRATAEDGTSLGYGDEAPYRDGLTLSVASPREADLLVVCDGRPVARAEAAQQLQMPLAEPGVYRVEARLDGRPWVFTNPVYLRRAPDGQDVAGQ